MEKFEKRMEMEREVIEVLAFATTHPFLFLTVSTHTRASEKACCESVRCDERWCTCEESTEREGCVTSIHPDPTTVHMHAFCVLA